MNVETARERIIRTLAGKGPLQAEELYDECGGMAKSTFYKHLRQLVEEGRIVKKEKGRYSFYALKEDAWKLHSLVDNRTALEQHVMKGARQILDELMTIDLSDPKKANRAMSWRSGMLAQAVHRLRGVRPGLPNINDPDYEEYEDEDEPGSFSLAGWYRYWLDVLDALKAL